MFVVTSQSVVGHDARRHTRIPPRLDVRACWLRRLLKPYIVDHGAGPVDYPKNVPVDALDIFGFLEWPDPVHSSFYALRV